MDEKEPKYITSLRDDLKNHIDTRINGLEITLKSEINDLAMMTANSFKEVFKEFGNVREEINGMKVDIAEIKYNIADIRDCMMTKQELQPILQDHKFRITKLEKEAFA